MWYQIDAVDRISAVSPEWAATATKGGAPELTASRVIGRSIWAFLKGEAVFLRYAALFESVRQNGQRKQLRFQEDRSPGHEVMELNVHRFGRHCLHIDSRIFSPVTINAVHPVLDQYAPQPHMISAQASSNWRRVSDILSHNPTVPARLVAHSAVSRSSP